MDVVIIGAGGHGKVIADAILARGEHRPVGFVDANDALAGDRVLGLPVLGPINLLGKLGQSKQARGAIVAIGDNRVRQRYAAEVRAAKLELVTVVHPAATVSASASIGAGSFLAAGAIVCAEATIGEAAILNTACVVDHETTIGAACHIAPGALLAGRVHVGQRVFIGMGAKVIQCLHIGDDAIVGAGAVIIRDVADGAKVLGVPARVCG